jgi:hypothetical protein
MDSFTRMLLPLPHLAGTSLSLLLRYIAARQILEVFLVKNIEDELIAGDKHDDDQS